MLVLAYQFMAQCPVEHLKEVMDLFSLTALEICEGQQMDMEFEQRNDVKEEEYLEMIRLKTSVLLAASLKIGALLGGASADDATRLYDFGMNMGVAFQLKMTCWMCTVMLLSLGKISVEIFCVIRKPIC